MMGVVPRAELAESEVPFIAMAEHVAGGWGRWAAVTATIMASLSAFSVTLGASARVMFALGRDGHFPRKIARLNRRFRTPDVALLICSVVVLAFGSTGIVKFVASVSDFGYLMGLGIVNYSVIALRTRMPNLRRPFRVALYPGGPDSRSDHHLDVRACARAPELRPRGGAHAGRHGGIFHPACEPG